MAVHCAHQLDADFPGGQLYANMRGFDPSGASVQPPGALRSFLTALGVPEKNQPQDIDAQVALYRSAIAGRRIMVVIDNVRDSQHARPLLPGTPGSAAIVTSRDALTGLIVQQGALPIALDLLSRVEAQIMLEQRIGAERVAVEPAAVDEIIDFCAGVPLALAIFSARACHTYTVHARPTGRRARRGQPPAGLLRPHGQQQRSAHGLFMVVRTAGQLAGQIVPAPGDPRRPDARRGGRRQPHGHRHQTGRGTAR